MKLPVFLFLQSSENKVSNTAIKKLPCILKIIAAGMRSMRLYILRIAALHVEIGRINST